MLGVLVFILADIHIPIIENFVVQPRLLSQLEYVLNGVRLTADFAEVLAG